MGNNKTTLIIMIILPIRHIQTMPRYMISLFLIITPPQVISHKTPPLEFQSHLALISVSFLIVIYKLSE